MSSPYPEKRDALKVTGVEYLSPSFLDRLEAGLDMLLTLIPWRVPYTDLEVVGSFGCNCARPGSDLDINIRFPDEAAQKAAWEAYSAHDKHEYVQAKWALRHQLGIVIQVGMRNHDSRGYWPVYSLRERKLYNRKPGEVRALHGKWDDSLKRWVERAPPTPAKRAAHMSELQRIIQETRQRHGTA